MRAESLRFILYILWAILWSPGLAAPADGWFEFQPGNLAEPGRIGMADWLDAPAGKHGFLQIAGENLVFEDGTKVKFWGTNICSHLPFVEAATADSFVTFLSRYGVNAVRFHKMSWSAYARQSTRLDPVKFGRLDYFQAKLREQGIYYGWSHIYGQRVQPGDSALLLNWPEIQNLKYPWAHLNGSTSGLVNFASDLQDLSIALTVNMLEHVNPLTGLRYADDPALIFIEFQNEDNIFWAAIENALEQAPTYRKLLCRMFSEWLISKYGNQKNLEKAWDKENIPAGETLAEKNINPRPNHGLFDWEYRTALKEKRNVQPHFLDKMRFLYETQLKFYQKFEAAIRATGYKGVLVGSCWQAGSGFAHFYNLHADYAVGMIDRHNYFGGGAGGHALATGAVKNVSLLEQPGSGLLSTGMQQVVDRPFSFSEWMSLVPNPWTAEAAPIIAAYGMGLQGWDASFSFATDLPRFSRLLQSETHGIYNATSPLHFGLYPLLARMIYRGDISESPVLGTRNVHLPSLETGKLGFVERVEQGFDDKYFTGTIDAKTLAVGKIPVRFTDDFVETRSPDLTAFYDSTANRIQSVTGELEWHFGAAEYFTINTAATKGVIGFTSNAEISLGDWKIRTPNPFAVVLLTSLDRDKDLNQADEILIATISRGKNSGMRYSAGGDSLIEKGTRPLLLEPVDVWVQNDHLPHFSLMPLDHSGNLVQAWIPVPEPQIHLNGAVYQTMYYLLKREKSGIK